MKKKLMLMVAMAVAMVTVSASGWAAGPLIPDLKAAVYAQGETDVPVLVATNVYPYRTYSLAISADNHCTAYVYLFQDNNTYIYMGRTDNGLTTVRPRYVGTLVVIIYPDYGICDIFAGIK